MERWKEELLPLLPTRVQKVLSEISESDRLLEIRLRADRPMQLVSEKHDRIVFAPGGEPMVAQEECAGILSTLCERSVYAWETELSNGFLTLPGGYRVGVSGRAVTGVDGKIRYTAINGFCIRIVREHIGAAAPLIPFVSERGQLLPTLLISPPNCGKTTVLRDLIRTVSDGENGLAACRVCVADERFELCGSGGGRAAFQVGCRTDIVSGMAKAAALERMLASLSPQVIATDELNTAEDASAVHRASGCGVTVLATAHAGGFKDLFLRESFRMLLQDWVFKRIVLLSDHPIGSVAAVCDGGGGELYRREEST